MDFWITILFKKYKYLHTSNNFKCIYFYQKSIPFIITIILNLASLSFAQLSPGDLHKSHSHLEGIENCTTCHERGKKLSSDNCLSCHTLLKEQIAKNKGLHSNKEFSQCETCHVDHLGRNYEMVFWEEGKENFNHAKTSYKLEGKHKELKCAKCHNAENIVNPKKLKDKKKDLNRTFLGLNDKCLSCHNDEHRGQLKNDCLSCHTMKGWKPAPGFDHNKTKYRLTGKHKNVKCAKCHKTVVDNKFTDDNSFIKFSPLTFASCKNCHKDVHKNKFGPNCTKCHKTSGWADYSQKNFNHNKTKYPLKGLHLKLKCEKCHKPGKPLKIKKYKQCSNCHFDTHRNQFADRVKKGACEECHTVNGFLPSSFTTDMHTECDYPLEGSHLAVPCFACHKKITFSSRRVKTTQFKFKSTRCIACHEDVHKGQTQNVSQKKSIPVGKDGCEFCHKVDSWSDISFNHDGTKFPLKGQHEKTNCISCHKKDGKVVDSWAFTDIGSTCSSCHKDQHQGQFASRSGEIDCAKCHTSTDWFAEKFNHEKDTRFSLKGGHQFVSCNACHKTETKNGMKFVRYKPLEKKCESCHLEKNIKSQNQKGRI
jgi:hypothetical protein